MSHCDLDCLECQQLLLLNNKPNVSWHVLVRFGSELRTWNASLAMASSSSPRAHGSRCSEFRLSPNTSMWKKTYCSWGIFARRKWTINFLKTSGEQQTNVTVKDSRVVRAHYYLVRMFKHGTRLQTLQHISALWINVQTWIKPLYSGSTSSPLIIQQRFSRDPNNNFQHRLKQRASFTTHPH